MRDMGRSHRTLITFFMKWDSWKFLYIANLNIYKNFNYHVLTKKHKDMLASFYIKVFQISYNKKIKIKDFILFL